MLKIMPIRHLKDTAGMSKYVKEAKEPVIITKNGYADMIMMSVDVFNELIGETVYVKKRKSNKEEFSYISEKIVEYNTK